MSEGLPPLRVSVRVRVRVIRVKAGGVPKHTHHLTNPTQRSQPNPTHPDPTRPNSTFSAPVWSCLYAMIGLSLAIVANSTGLASAPCRMLLVHYAFNLAWAPVFFGAHKMMAG